MGAPSSEVGYTSATTRMGDHEVYVGMWGHWEVTIKLGARIDSGSTSISVYIYIYIYKYFNLYIVYSLPISVYDISNVKNIRHNLIAKIKSHFSYHSFMCSFLSFTE
jgi:hypothetical protein